MRVAIFIPSLVGGGAERAKLKIAGALAEMGHDVDLVVATSRSFALRASVPPAVNLILLDAERTLSALPRLCRYLRRSAPDLVISALDEANVTACIAKLLTGARCALVVTIQAHLSSVIAYAPDRRWCRTLRVARLVYRYADVIGAVSTIVARDAEGVLGLPRGRVVTLLSPVVDQAFFALSHADVEHPWFAPAAPPVILACGRLAAQKDYATLLEAFALVRRQHRCRLLVLGEGPLRGALETMATELGIAKDVRFEGFDPNPYRFMRRAAVFALASRWEGLPNVLVEALACGARVVATDSASGARELLDNDTASALGHLVPVGSPERLAEALLDALTTDRPAPATAALLHRHCTRQVALDYLRAVGIGPEKKAAAS